MRPESDYEQSFLTLVILGSVIFLIGETGNCICHIQLRKFRDEKRPTFLLFNHVSCPHYFFEILPWTGFFLAKWTLAAVLFLLATIITLVVYARKKHTAYLEEFDGKDGSELYPVNRKALIPFIY